MAEDVVAELRALREELVRLRIQQARTMALLLAMAKSMTSEAVERIERRLMALDDNEPAPAHDLRLDPELAQAVRSALSQLDRPQSPVPPGGPRS